MKKENQDILHKLRKSIKKMEQDKKTNPITWVAQFHAKDDSQKKVIKLGIRKEGHLLHIYYDFDTHEPDGCASSEEEVLKEIKKRWGYMDTFQWIK